MRGLNDDEAPALLRCCLDHGYELRFIEQMPLDAQHGWKREEMVTAEEIFLSLSGRVRALRRHRAARGAAPAETFLVDGGPGRVGIIASVTRPFCGACDRVRLTADGQIRNCLFARAESDLRAPLRSGASTRRSPHSGGRRWRRSCRGTGSTTRPSSSRTGPCRRSAASPKAGKLAGLAACQVVRWMPMWLQWAAGLR